MKSGVELNAPEFDHLLLFFFLSPDDELKVLVYYRLLFFMRVVEFSGQTSTSLFLQYREIFFPHFPN